MNSTSTTEADNLNSDIFSFRPDVSFPDYQDVVRKEHEKDIALEELKKDIGDSLFNSLSEEDRLFILKTEGSINLGYKMGKNDLKRIFSHIENDYSH